LGLDTPPAGCDLAFALETKAKRIASQWLGYLPLEASNYLDGITYLRDNAEQASDLLPRVHRIFSLLMRWLLGTHQGAVRAQHLQDYLDEFAFRFQPPQIAQPGQTVLPPRPTVCGNGTRHLSADRRLGSDAARHLTTIPWGYLSQMGNQFAIFFLDRRSRTTDTPWLRNIPALSPGSTHLNVEPQPS
jgi:hypothetical protein